MSFGSGGTRTMTQRQLQSTDTRVIFASGPSPYILGATLKKHVSQYTEKFPDTADVLLNNTYVDDVQSGGDHSDQLISLQRRPQRLRRKVVFISTNGTVTYQSWKTVRELKTMQCPLKKV